MANDEMADFASKLKIRRAAAAAFSEKLVHCLEENIEALNNSLSTERTIPGLKLKYWDSGGAKAAEIEADRTTVNIQVNWKPGYINFGFRTYFSHYDSPSSSDAFVRFVGSDEIGQRKNVAEEAKTPQQVATWLIKTLYR